MTKIEGIKLETQFENPIDLVLNSVAVKMNKILYACHFTPNIITLISLIVSLIGIYYIQFKYYKLGALLFFVGYFFDCADGIFARKYNMMTKFGDYFDHISDIVKMILLYSVIQLSDLHYTNKIVFYVITAIFIVLLNLHLGCQETYYNKKSSLDITKKLCWNKEHIKYTKYVGCGTFFVVLCTYLFFMNEINTLFT